MARRRPNRWLIMSLGLLAQTCTSAYLYGLPMVLPQLRRTGHLSLATAGWLVAAPSIGLLTSLIAWGVVVDRRGERDVMAIGLALAGGCLLLAAPLHGFTARFVLLLLAGAVGGAIPSASGRVVMGWFEANERGTVMGVRQTAQPLGVALAAMTFPPLANQYGVGWALVLPAALCLVVSVLVLWLVVDPARSEATDTEVTEISPYRTATLWRLHGSSALLVIPQFAVGAFALEFLVTQRHWSTVGAGRLLFVFQLLGAAGRVAAGRWSDRAGSRLGPMRIIAGVAAATMLAISLGAARHSVLAVVALGVGVVVTVADNGLGFTAVAELAGTLWSGRAMGVQNTGQNITASLTPPLLGALITVAGFATGFAIVAAFPVIAVLSTPVAAETGRARRAP
jgi:sugar phosphate permease